MWRLFLLPWLLVTAVAATSSKIDPALAKTLENGEKVSVVVSFTAGIEPTLRSIGMKRRGWNRGSHIKSVVDALGKNADSSQVGVLKLLSARSGDGYKYFKRYPTSNLIYVKEATPAMIQSIAEDEQVSKIWEEPVVELVSQLPLETDIPENADDDSSTNTGSGKAKGAWYSGILQLPEAWAEAGGKGEGIVVGLIDTGVRATHGALKDKFVGLDYGWHDPVEGNPEPNDSSKHFGHGTGVASIILANDFNGRVNWSVAPAAKYMACKACGAAGCPYEALRDCIQWMECPTLNGSNPDCSKAPQIVNNSWQSVRGTDVYNEDILRWRTMGILPVFAIGNDGDKCETTAAPGELPFVIGVGSVFKAAHNDSLWLSYHSGRGPTPDGRFKPDVVAPGNSVEVAGNFHDNSLSRGSGTSFATPFVSGLLALLLVRDPDLTYDEAYDLITTTADPNVMVHYEPRSCGNLTVGDVPNHNVGYGVINLVKALKAQTELLQTSKP